MVVAAARRGEHHAIGPLAGEAYRTIVTFYRYTGVASDVAEDLAADAVERIITKLPQLKKASAYDAWMWSIARNLLRSYWRSTSRPKVVEPPSPEPSRPDELAVIAEEHREIAEALQELSLRDRELLWLREVLGLDYREIARRVDANPATIRVACHRARQRLREAYGDG